MFYGLFRTLVCTLAAIATAAAAEDRADYRLGAGDTVRVQVFQNPDLTIDARVSESGSISYPLVGTVAIGGSSLAAAEKKIADALQAGGFVKQPQVNIVLTQVRGNQVAVLGQVNRPGRFPLETFNTRVTDMLAAAGGATAAGDDVAIVTGVRDGKPFRRLVDIPSIYLGQQSGDDIVLSGGDAIYVHRAPVFYIYGETQRPGAHRIERGMTIRQALAQGGGPNARGSEDRLVLHRKRANGETEAITPNLADAVHPNDVIQVRERIF